MKRLAGLAFLAAVAVLLLLFITNPELLDKVWIWLVGLAGYVIIFFENGYRKLTQAFGNKDLREEIDGVHTTPEDLQSRLSKMEERVLRLEKQLGQNKDPSKAANDKP